MPPKLAAPFLLGHRDDTPPFREKFFFGKAKSQIHSRGTVAAHDNGSFRVLSGGIALKEAGHIGRIPWLQRVHVAGPVRVKFGKTAGKIGGCESATALFPEEYSRWKHNAAYVTVCTCKFILLEVVFAIFYSDAP